MENVLTKYPIKELTNNQYKQSLIDSLHKGNLQKATFVDKDGKEEKLYISPNITLGALKVYDQHKQPIPTDVLVEKQYIGRNWQKNKQRVNQQQKPDQIQKQAQAPSPKQEQSQKQTQGQKQKNDAPVKKQTRKQKVK